MLDPVHFLARIAALVPPPRFPLTTLAGVLAPYSPLRAEVVKYGRAAGALLPAPATQPKNKNKSNAASLLLAATTPSPPREQDAVRCKRAARFSVLRIWSFAMVSRKVAIPALDGVSAEC